ncbi:MAG: hypothetical protein EOM85_02475 [Candidatus Moranbacteria bacterium]|nr:hypothetical protein [Candidatus Moranbacteria bacterium]
MENNSEQKNSSQLKTVRTYSTDMAEAVRENEATVIKIAMAEKERQEQEDLYKKAEGTKTSKILFFVGGIILIGLAIFGLLFIQNKNKIKEEQSTTEKQKIGTYINYDNALFIDASDIANIINLTSVLRSHEPEEKDGVNAIFLTEQVDEKNTSLINKDDFISISGITAPTSLTRSLSSSFLLGKYRGGASIGGSSTFLIFGVNDYNQAYASMLDWEKSMFKDLFILFDIAISDSDSALFEKDWKDLIVNNKDTRVLYAENGEGILFYSFVNKNILVITKDIETMKKLITAVTVKNPQ